MKEFKFVISIGGSAKGNVFANNKKEAEKLLQGGQWDDIDIDVESIYDIESLTEVKSDRSKPDFEFVPKFKCDDTGIISQNY